MEISFKELFILSGIRQKELIIHFSFHLKDIFKCLLQEGVNMILERRFAVASPLRMHSGLESHSGEE